MLPVTRFLHPYLSSVGHLDRGIDRQHSTNVLQSGAVSLQTLKRQTTTQQRLHVLGLPITSSPLTHIVLNHARRVRNHGLVVSKLLVASSSVVIAGAQNIVHRSVRGNAVDRLRVLIIRPYKRTHLVDGLGELAGFEELISRSLVSLQRRKLVNLLFSLDLCLEMNSHSRSHLRLRNLQKTEEVGIVCIVGETLVQDVFRFHELSLHIISSQHSYEVDHGIRSTMVTLQEGLVTLNASKTVSLCLTPLS